MSRYLGVANQTTTSPRLLQELRDLGRREADAQFVLVVPATPVRDLFFRRAPTRRPRRSRASTPTGGAYLEKGGVAVARR
jgi:hypothetical protein